MPMASLRVHIMPLGLMLTWFWCHDLLTLLPIKLVPRMSSLFQWQQQLDFTAHIPFSVLSPTLPPTPPTIPSHYLLYLIHIVPLSLYSIPSFCPSPTNNVLSRAAPLLSVYPAVHSWYPHQSLPLLLTFILSNNSMAVNFNPVLPCVTPAWTSSCMRTVYCGVSYISPVICCLWWASTASHCHYGNCCCGIIVELCCL